MEMRYDIYFRFFLGDVMFSCNVGHRTEAKTTTLMFRPVRQVAALGESLLSASASCWRSE